VALKRFCDVCGTELAFDPEVEWDDETGKAIYPDQNPPRRAMRIVDELSSEPDTAWDLCEADRELVLELIRNISATVKESE
jgi:hypothetical protein